MFTKKRKKGVTIPELLGALALSGVLAGVIATLTVFVGNATKQISENSIVTLDSSNCSLLLLNQVNGITVNDADISTVTCDKEISIYSTKQFYYDSNTGSFSTITSENDNWRGSTQIAFKIDSFNNSLNVTSIDKDGNRKESLHQFTDSKIVTDESYITIKEASTYTYLLEVKITYRSEHSKQQKKSYYSSIYINKVL